MQVTGERAVPAEVVEYIAGKTDGVPLYVEEPTKGNDPMFAASGLHDADGNKILDQVLATDVVRCVMDIATAPAT